MSDIIKKQATVTQILIDHDDNELIRVKLENGDEEVLIISDAVWVYDNSKFRLINTAGIEIGREVFVYLRSTTPMMMSMPPKYVPEVLVINNNDDYMDHKFMFFNKKLISADNQVEISEEFLNVIESNDYRPLIKEMLIDQDLLVFYKKSTKSIPAIIHPEKIIIL